MVETSPILSDSQVVMFKHLMSFFLFINIVHSLLQNSEKGKTCKRKNWSQRSTEVLRVDLSSHMSSILLFYLCFKQEPCVGHIERVGFNSKSETRSLFILLLNRHGTWKINSI